MTVFKAMVLICALVGLFAGMAGASSLSTVLVGNPGNEVDSRYGGYGSVGYTYNIGKYEVTAGQYAEFLNKVGGVDTYGLYNAGMSDTSFGSGITRSGDGIVGSPYTYSVASEFVNRPVNYVSYWDSCRFANWLHNGRPTGEQGAGTTETGAYALTADGINNNTVTRNVDWKWAVANENEWYKAAYYKGGSANAGYFDYPTGSDTAPGQDMADVSGNNANYYTAPYNFPIDSDKYTTVGGEFENSNSPYGTFDQGGNLWEWNESVFDNSSRGLRGGSFYSGDSSLLASNRTYFGQSVGEYGYVGFRVVGIPEPCCALMVLAGAFGLASIRRRR